MVMTMIKQQAKCDNLTMASVQQQSAGSKVVYWQQHHAVQCESSGKSVMLHWHWHG